MHGQLYVSRELILPKNIQLFRVCQHNDGSALKLGGAERSRPSRHPCAVSPDVPSESKLEGRVSVVSPSLRSSNFSRRGSTQGLTSPRHTCLVSSKPSDRDTIRVASYTLLDLARSVVIRCVIRHSKSTRTHTREAQLSRVGYLN